MKVKSESEVAQLCPTLSDPMYYSARQASLCTEFFRQEYGSGLPLNIIPTYMKLVLPFLLNHLPLFFFLVMYYAYQDTLFHSTFIALFHCYLFRLSYRASFVAQLVKNPPAMRETWA